jgi:hypothetical protein
MIKLKIGKHKVKMASLLSEIPLYKGLEIMGLLQEKEPSLVDKISIISLLSDLDVNIISLFEDKSIDLIYSKLEFSKKQVATKFFSSFRLNGTTFGLKNFDEMTVREWGDIEFWLQEGDTSFINLSKILAVVYRPIISKKRTLQNILNNMATSLLYKKVVPKRFKSFQIDSLKDIHANNAQQFDKELDFSFAWGVLLYIFSYTQQIKSEYSILFKTDEQLKEIEEDPFKGDPNIKEFGQVWGMYHTVISISENIIERDIWLEKPLKEFYKYLSYLKQKNIYDQKNGR